MVFKWIKDFFIKLCKDSNEDIIIDKIYEYFKEKKIDHDMYKITGIVVRTRYNKIYVYIYAERAGILVGRRGRNIDALTKWINQKISGHAVIISIEGV